MPVHLKRKNGEVTPYKNSEYIPAFYFIPKEAMTKLPKELRELPRNPWFIFRDWDAIKIVESDLFLELMMDGYACLTWPYLGIGGDMEAYSGYDPAYVIAHSCGIWVETMTNLGIIPTTNELLKKASSVKAKYTNSAMHSLGKSFATSAVILLEEECTPAPTANT